MNKSSVKFLDLPNEMIAAILDKLDLIDFFKSRLISKRFKFIIDNHEYYNLEIKKIYLSNILKHFNDEISLFLKLILNFKILCCHVHFDNQFNLEFINQFSKIKFLKLTTDLNTKSIEENYLIKLPSLKKLEIHNIMYMFDDFFYKGDKEPESNYHITFECENLKKLKINQKTNLFKFKFPESIILLECDCNNRKFVSQFKNIEIMKLYDTQLDEETLMNFENLEEIYIFLYIYPASLSFFNHSYVNKLLKLNNSKNMKPKKIYLYNIEMTEPMDDCNFKKIINSHKSLITYQLLNYKLLSDDHFDYKTINYSELINYLNNNRDLFKNLEMNKLIPELPANFFQKFNRYKHVTIEEMKVDDKFICFLKHCYCISSLNIIKCDLDQSSLDQLSIFSNSLSELELSKLNKLDGKEINFDFIGQLDHLNCLKINQSDDLKNLITNVKPYLISKYYNDLKKYIEYKFKSKIKKMNFDSNDHSDHLNSSKINQCDKLKNEISNFEFITKLKCVTYLKIFLNSNQSKKFDLNYFLGLKNIEHLNTNLEFSDAKLLMNLFKNCKKLYLFKFYYLDKFVIIKRFFDNIKKPISIWDFNFELYDEKTSQKYFKSNSNQDQLYNIRYFNLKLSRYGLNYDQLGEYIKEIPNLLQIELKEGNEYVYTKDFRPGLCTYIDGHFNDLF